MSPLSTSTALTTATGAVNRCRMIGARAAMER
jgi:hypothetical protein